MIKSGIRCWSIAITAFLLMFSLAVSGAELRMSVLLSNDSLPYQNFFNALKKNAPATAQLSVAEVADALTENQAKADLIVAVGSKACAVAMRQYAVPVLAVMIPQSGYEALLASLSSPKKTQNFSALYLNQPWDRQLDFLFALLPEHRKVGVLYSPNTEKEIAHLQEEVNAHAGVLLAQAVESDDTLFADLESVLRNSDVLLATPNSNIYSSTNVRNILLSTYRFNVPLIGFSQAYVNAGAVAAIFSTPEQLADQAAAMLLSFTQKGHLPVAQFPNAYTISINQQVAHSLNLSFEDEKNIRIRMRKRGRSAND